MKCSYSMVIIILTTTAAALLDQVQGLFCYDSSTQKPSFPRECEPNKKMCYSEYVAIGLFEGYFMHQFDRFCAYSADCEQRGLQDQCLSMDELDVQVLATFVDKLSKNGYKKSDVKYSRFCCCSNNLCNNFDISKAMNEYNITDNSTSSGIDPCLSPSLHLLIYFLSLLKIFSLLFDNFYF